MSVSFDVCRQKSERLGRYYTTFFLFAYRTSVLEAIDDSPFYVLYGREPRLTVGVKYLAPVADDVTASVFEHRKGIVEKVELAQNLAREILQCAQQKMKEFYD